jgi:hypothetical protein
MGKMWFVAGLAVGYVLGARAGRETYDQLARTARQIWDSPSMQEAAGMVQAQATRLVDTAKDKVGLAADKIDRANDADQKLTNAQARFNSA